ncbi:hypothetical protein NM208_g8191 [Fusarium decemcellulare]|uniref:Uncharacterized protein n=1 Tax=Fusarium decemcellulare TaxID=57161 RepID=A0ACC1S6I0_9HYPO|nr:hypothetical protein NM208_g8191 [Fusarium decemcellulare]
METTENHVDLYTPRRVFIGNLLNAMMSKYLQLGANQAFWPNGEGQSLKSIEAGFQKYPQDKEFYVPFHPEYNGGRLSESGIVGQWGYERGLTYYEVQLAGHELPGYTAGAGYRVVELLLGRIKNLGTIENFTTQKGDFQGNNTAHTSHIVNPLGFPWGHGF